MASLKEIRNRIVSVQSTQKITGAMKLVSAAKLRRAQTAIIGLRPYSNKLNDILSNLSASVENSENSPLFAQRDLKKVLLIVITSNRGLCGSFNSSIIKEVSKIVESKYKSQFESGNLELICIGKKGKEQLEKKFNIVGFYDTILDKAAFDQIAVIAEQLMQDYTVEKYDKVEVLYNKFINPATQRIELENYLPIENIQSEQTIQNNVVEYIFEPSQAELLDVLIPKILKIQLYKTLLDSIASEHGARMTSMSKATDNANELLRDLKLKYNNARQAAITNELNEIVGGAEALKG
ncbi:MAG TPA: ATP synthase F1 subunit gamma [Bacteroidales bacterium]|nr:ATP synthase F1 subunit gamma [Bacteroidales bacterium]